MPVRQTYQGIFMKDNIAVITIDFSNDIETSLSTISTMKLLDNSKVHLIHVSPILSGTTNEEIQELERVRILFLLKQIQDKFFHELRDDSVECKCIFSQNKEEAICDYASRVNADVVITPSRRQPNHEIKDGHVAHYLLSHCPVSVLVAR